MTGTRTLAITIALLIITGPAIGSLLAWSATRIRRARTAHPDLADPGAEHIGCGCRYWDEEGDRCQWLPCANHLDLLYLDLHSGDLL